METRATQTMPGALERKTSVWEEGQITMTPTELQRQHLDDVWRYVSSRLDRHEDAEDVTMEVMVAAFRRLEDDTVLADPKLWLLTIAKNKVTDALRRKYRRKEAPLVDSDHLEEIDHVKRFAVNSILDQMPEDHSQALVLKYVNGLSTEEVAVVLKKSPDAANSLLQRARQRFRELGSGTFEMTDREEK